MTQTNNLYYSLVNSAGEIEQAQFTTDSSVSVAEGYRLVLDNPHLIDVDLSKYYVKRITPVLLEHTEVQYEIVPADSQIEDQFIDSRAPEQ